jgi:transposase
MGPGDLLDAEWELVEPLLASERRRWARSAGDNRWFLNRMLHVLRVGRPWRDMHERYGKWNSVYVRFRRWARRLGRPAANADRSRTGRRLAAHDRQHHRSRPRLGGGRKRGACAQAFGRSGGGFASKVHARCDNQGLPVGFILTGGEASDYTAADDLMAMPLPKPKALLADKGYDGDRLRENLLMRSILPIIPPRSNRKVPVHPDTIGDTRIAIVLSACSANSNNNGASPLVMIKPPCRSTASSTLPPHGYG